MTFFRQSPGSVPPWCGCRQLSFYLSPGSNLTATLLARGAPLWWARSNSARQCLSQRRENAGPSHPVGTLADVPVCFPFGIDSSSTDRRGSFLLFGTFTAHLQEVCRRLQASARRTKSLLQWLRWRTIGSLNCVFVLIENVRCLKSSSRAVIGDERNLPKAKRAPER